MFLYGSYAQAISDLNGRFLDCNRRFSHVTGYDRMEARGLSLLPFLPPADAAEQMRCVLSLVVGVVPDRRDL